MIVAWQISSVVIDERVSASERNIIILGVDN